MRGSPTCEREGANYPVLKATILGTLHRGAEGADERPVAWLEKFREKLKLDGVVPPSHATHGNNASSGSHVPHGSHFHALP